MIVSRARYEEMKAFLTARIMELEAERRRLHDIVYSHQLGEQLFDSLPKKEIVAAAEAEDAPQPEQSDAARWHDDTANLLTSIKHGQVSKLGPAMARALNHDLVARAKAANPAAFGLTPPEVYDHFDTAKKDALKQ